MEQKGLTQTGVRRFINKSDGEPAMKALKDAAAKALEGVESIGQESPVGDHQANGDIESTVRTLEAQMRATRFGLKSRLGRQLAHDDPILMMWIPTFAGDTIAKFRKGPDGKTPGERELGRKWAGDSLEFGERFFMKEVEERGSGAVKRDWEPRLIEVRNLGQHARTGTMIGITADGIVCGRHGRRLPEAERWDQTGWQDLKGVPWDLRPTPEVDVEAQPGAAEAERRERRWQRPRERAESVRPRDEAPRGGVQEKRAAAAAPASASDAAETEPSAKRTQGGETRAREFYVVRKDGNRFGPTARCPGCADVTKGSSVKHARNDDFRNRIAKLFMDESAQRVDSFFGRTRVREETSPGRAVLSSGAATVVTDAQTVKRKAEETVETNAQAKERQTAVTPVPQVQDGGSSSSRSETEQRAVVPSEVPQDTRSSIEDMEIGQLRVKREVQGVSLDANKRELQRLARDSAEYYFRDEQVEASDALIDEVGALLTESGGAQVIEICSKARFTAKAGDLGLRPGFAVDLSWNKPYGPH